MMKRKMIKGYDLIGYKMTDHEVNAEEFAKFNDLRELIEEHFINETEVIASDDKEIIIQVRLRKGTGSIKKLRHQLYGQYGNH